MATRPRNGSTRTKSATPPPVLDDAVDPSLQSARSTRDGGDAPSATVERTHLERHEIPSFSESREARIAEAAYWRAERRGFVSGQELDDWLAAEREVDDQDERPRGAPYEDGSAQREAGRS